MIDREKLRAEFRAYLNENKSEIDTVSNIIINTIPHITRKDFNIIGDNVVIADDDIRILKDISKKLNDNTSLYTNIFEFDKEDKYALYISMNKIVKPKLASKIIK